MKNIILIMIVFFFSCKKEVRNISVNDFAGDKQSVEISKKLYSQMPLFLNAEARTVGFYHTCVNSYFDDTYNSTGLNTFVDVARLRLGNSNIKSYWIGAYYYVTMPDGFQETRWVQWGYAVSKDFGLFAAFFVYHFPNNQSGGILYPLTINYFDNTADLKYNTRCKFEFKNKPGTTFFTFLRYDQPVMEVDLQTTVLAGIFQACTESYGDDTFNPVINIDYVQVQRDGQWVKIPRGLNQGRKWDIEGKNLIPSYDISQFKVGGRLSQPYYPMDVW